ncbi:MAG TPA: delta-60 repeat domain-containing protein, partial [Candidatus Acidoferrum sp.]|nr:delta-60 repeat domain-containing protein [Candidatus Acidoferrum sp.]
GPGEADNTFDPGFGANKFVRAVAVQADGKILVGGAFTNFANVTNQNFLARLNANGVLDTNFNVTNINAIVSAIQVMTDGRIVIGGAFTNVNSNALSRVARLNTNGSLDTTWSQPSLMDAAVNTLDLFPDGRIVAGGGFSLPTRGVTRLRLNGSTDLTFDLGSGTDATVLAAKVQPDGMILIGGAFTNVSGFTYPRLARIAVNGLVDTSFQPLTITNGNVLGIAVQASGKIVIVGNFRFVNGIFRSGVARLNSDGSLDLTFNPGTGANGTVHTVQALANGEVFIGGDFTTVNDIPRGRYALLLPDGTVNPEFDSSVGANNTVYASVLQADQKIVIGGDFTTVTDLPRRGVARLNVGEVLGRIAFLQFSAGSAILTVNTSPGRTYTLEGSTNMVQWLELSTQTASGTTLVFNDPSASGFAYRFYRVRRQSP